jgi:hypothetical protein
VHRVQRERPDVGAALRGDLDDRPVADLTGKTTEQVQPGAGRLHVQQTRELPAGFFQQPCSPAGVDLLGASQVLGEMIALPLRVGPLPGRCQDGWVTGALEAVIGGPSRRLP